MKRLSGTLGLWLMALIIGSLLSCQEDAEDITTSTKQNPQDVPDSVLFQYAEKYSYASFTEVRERSKTHDFKGKSIAYIGASLANNPESAVAKAVVCNSLDCAIYTYGRGGHSYGGTTQTLRNCVAELGRHDVYVLWGTTNDYFLSVSPGNATDFLTTDNSSAAELKTMCGGINYVIRKIRRINPSALILGYTSLKFFNQDRPDGMLRSATTTNGVGEPFYKYVDAQETCFEQSGIPYLNQWDFEDFTQSSCQDYYFADGVHLNKDGYFIIGVKHLDFLLKQIEQYDKTINKEVVPRGNH